MDEFRANKEYSIKLNLIQSQYKVGRRAGLAVTKHTCDLKIKGLVIKVHY